MSANVKKLLKKFKSEIKCIYGKQLKSVYLYGSYARGDARPDSDIDLLMVVKGEFINFEILNRSVAFPPPFYLKMM